MDDKYLYILVSNRALPTKDIGSWTTRITKLNQNNTVFDYILSPSDHDENYIYCRKRRFLSWKKIFRYVNLKFWVAKEYINAVVRLSKKASGMTIVVMDDIHLLEAMVLVKSQCKCQVKIIFSFHGFSLNVNTTVLEKIDKVLYLSQLALDHNKRRYSKHPLGSVVGNGVDSDTFYPLDLDEFYEARTKRGYTNNAEILIWVANDRPKKGIALFHKIIEALLVKYPDLKVIIVGSELKYDHENVANIGRVSNDQVADYMQISNYYMFTTSYEEGFGLSMIEALKCGNAVMASSKGAIPEVLHNLNNTYLIEQIDDVNSWITAFELARKDTNFGTMRSNKEQMGNIWNYKDWEKRFIHAIRE